MGHLAPNHIGLERRTQDVLDAKADIPQGTRSLGTTSVVPIPDAQNYGGTAREVNSVRVKLFNPAPLAHASPCGFLQDSRYVGDLEVDDRRAVVVEHGVIRVPLVGCNGEPPHPPTISEYVYRDERIEEVFWCRSHLVAHL